MARCWVEGAFLTPMRQQPGSLGTARVIRGCPHLTYGLAASHAHCYWHRKEQGGKRTFISGLAASACALLLPTIAAAPALAREPNSAAAPSMPRGPPIRADRASLRRGRQEGG